MVRSVACQLFLGYVSGVAEKCDFEGLVRLSDAAKAAGVTVAQLSYYLQVGVVGPTQLSEAGQRLFDDRAVKRIAMVRMLNDGGYGLREIREIFMEGRT